MTRAIIGFVDGSGQFDDHFDCHYIHSFLACGAIQIELCPWLLEQMLFLVYCDIFSLL